MLKFLACSKEIRGRTDASKIGIGAVLFQVIEDGILSNLKSFSQTESVLVDH